MKKLLSPTFWSWFHACATVTWLLLIVPSLLWWHDSVMWVVLMSAWANVAAHWGSFQASQAEKRVKDNE